MSYMTNAMAYYKVTMTKDRKLAQWYKTEIPKTDNKKYYYLIYDKSATVTW